VSAPVSCLVLGVVSLAIASVGARWKLEFALMAGVLVIHYGAVSVGEAAARAGIPPFASIVILAAAASPVGRCGRLELQRQAGFWNFGYKGDSMRAKILSAIAFLVAVGLSYQAFNRLDGDLRLLAGALTASFAISAALVLVLSFQPLRKEGEYVAESRYARAMFALAKDFPFWSDDERDLGLCNIYWRLSLFLMEFTLAAAAVILVAKLLFGGPLILSLTAVLLVFAFFWYCLGPDGKRTKSIILDRAVGFFLLYVFSAVLLFTTWPDADIGSALIFAFPAAGFIVLGLYVLGGIMILGALALGLLGSFRYPNAVCPRFKLPGTECRPFNGQSSSERDEWNRLMRDLKVFLVVVALVTLIALPGGVEIAIEKRERRCLRALENRYAVRVLRSMKRRLSSMSATTPPVKSSGSLPRCARESCGWIGEDVVADDEPPVVGNPRLRRRRLEESVELGEHDGAAGVDPAIVVAESKLYPP
jgi:hypothetical protein